MARTGNISDSQRTRACKVFLRARPAALRTWTGDASFTSSVESITAYAGWVGVHDERPPPGQREMRGAHEVLPRCILELLGRIFTRMCVWIDEEE